MMEEHRHHGHDQQMQDTKPGCHEDDELIIIIIVKIKVMRFKKPNGRYNCGHRSVVLGGAIGHLGSWFRGVELVPSLDPCDHRVCKPDEVRVDAGEVFLHELGQFKVALLCCGALLGKDHRLEEGNELLLPEEAVELLFQVHKWVAGLAVPDVGQSRLDPQSQVIAHYLHVKVDASHSM